MTLILWGLAGVSPPSAPAQGLSPGAREVLDRLDDRIASARAGQASRHAFLAALEALEAAGDGCEDWVDLPAFRRDADLREVLEEVCPESVRPRKRASAAKPPAGSTALRAAASQSVRPAGDGAADPALSVSLRAPRAGLEATASGAALGRRRIWLRSASGGRSRGEGLAWGLQAGHLGFRDLGSDADGFSGSGSAPPPLPRLDFVTGRSRFPGSRWRSGLDGPLGSSFSNALDGAGLSTRAGPATAGAWAAWNRSDAAPDGSSPRRDAAIASLAGSLPLGGWSLQGEAASLRLEASDRPESRLHLAGAAFGTRSGTLRVGGAVSALDPPAPGDPSPAAGAYGELILSGADPGAGKPARYLLEIRRSTQAWAAPLSAAPALLRDTLEDGWILPGRGEGGLRARSLLPLFGGDGDAEGGNGGWEADLLAAGEAGWTDSGPLAGEGRLRARLARGPWSLEAGQGLRWRREDPPEGGGYRAASLAGAWRAGPWRASLAGTRRLGNPEDTWPLEASVARRAPGGSAWSAEARCADGLRPIRDWRLAFRQAWRPGRGVAWSHALRIPGKGPEAGQDLSYQVRLELAVR